MTEPASEQKQRLSTEAFTAELQGLIPQVRAFTRFLCRSDRAAADDLTQDTLTRAWTHRESFAPGTNMRAWLFVIARNTFYSERRKAKRTVSVEADQLDGAAAADSAQDHHMDLEDVRKALATLTDEQREALVLVAAGGFSYEEAAQVCGCAIGTIKSRVNRARTALAAATGHDTPIPAVPEL